MANTGFHAAKVFVFGAAVGVFSLEGYNFLTREARGPVCIIPFMPTSAAVSCVAEPQSGTERLCKCTDCGMRADTAKTAD